MAWENRAGKRYYYAKERRGKRVISHYQGARQPAATERQEWRALIDEQNALDTEISAVDAAISALVDGLLLATGYRQRKREWRKKRERATGEN